MYHNTWSVTPDGTVLWLSNDSSRQSPIYAVRNGGLASDNDVRQFDEVSDDDDADVSVEEAASPGITDEDDDDPDVQECDRARLRVPLGRQPPQRRGRSRRLQLTASQAPAATDVDVEDDDEDDVSPVVPSRDDAFLSFTHDGEVAEDVEAEAAEDVLFMMEDQGSNDKYTTMKERDLSTECRDRDIKNRVAKSDIPAGKNRADVLRMRLRQADRDDAETSERAKRLRRLDEREQQHSEHSSQVPHCLPTLVRDATSVLRSCRELVERREKEGERGRRIFHHI